jgi:hypothetical protein
MANLAIHGNSDDCEIPQVFLLHSCSTIQNHCLLVMGSVAVDSPLVAAISQKTLFQRYQYQVDSSDKRLNHARTNEKLKSTSGAERFLAKTQIEQLNELLG